jgi:hypothetical protein
MVKRFQFLAIKPLNQFNWDTQDEQDKAKHQTLNFAASG